MQSPAPHSANTHTASKGQTNRRIDDVQPRPAPKPEVHHIAVGESVEVKTKYSPLSAYMVNSKYIDPNAHLAPKRPLGALKQNSHTVRTARPALRPQAAFYDRAPGFAAEGAGITDRIRRSGRLTPMAAAPMGASLAGHHDDSPSHFAKASAAIAAFFLLMREKLAFAKDFIARKMQHFKLTHPRVHYSALHGAIVKKFGMRDAWFKLAVPVFLMASLLALGIFNGIMAPGERTFNPSGSGNSGVGSDNPTVQVRPPGGTSGGTSTQTGTNAANGQVQGSAGSQLQPSQTDPTTGLPVGGRGGGTATPTTPGVTTPSQTNVGSGTTGTGSDPTGSVTGGIIPITTTVPGKDIIVDDKRVIQTTDTGVTIN